MNLLRTALAGAACLALTAPAAALDFTMTFDDIPVAVVPPPPPVVPPPPDQELGSAVLGFYDNDPVYQRAGRQPWNISFSADALAICSSALGPDCSGNFPAPPSGDSAVGTVASSFFEFAVTPGLFVQQLSFWYTDAGQGSNPQVLLFSEGAQLGNPISLATCVGAFCEWKQYVVSAADLALGPVTSVRFSARPNSVVFDDIAATTAAIPEPSTYALMLGGLALVAGVARRRRGA